MAVMLHDPPYAVVIDDDPALREALGQALYEAGFVPLLASCAEDALDFMNGESAPVLVILDFGLPGMASWDLLARFKADARWSRAPVLLVSANPRSDIPDDLPVDAFMQKPLDLDELVRFARGAVTVGEAHAL